jgi:hypothetical protein
MLVWVIWNSVVKLRNGESKKTVSSYVDSVLMDVRDSKPIIRVSLLESGAIVLDGYGTQAEVKDGKLMVSRVDGRPITEKVEEPK